jgi:hypothetical protein
VIADVEHELGKALAVDQAEVAVALARCHPLLLAGAEGVGSRSSATQRCRAAHVRRRTEENAAGEIAHGVESSLTSL